MTEEELIKILEPLNKAFKELGKWCEMQMIRNNIMQQEIMDLKEQIDKLVKEGEAE